jgi:hypothetical protein
LAWECYRGSDGASKRALPIIRCAASTKAGMAA